LSALWVNIVYLRDFSDTS